MTNETIQKICSSQLTSNCLDHKVTIDVNALTNGEVSEKDYKGQLRLYWDGNGIFDKVMKTYDENLRIQYDNGRLVGLDYAKTYYSLITHAMERATDIEYKNQELDLKSVELCLRKSLECARMEMEAEKLLLEKEKLKLEREKIALEKKKLEEDLKLQKLQQESVVSQIRLYERQFDGFDDNLLLKLLKIQVDSFAMLFSSGMLDFEIKDLGESSPIPTPLKADEYADIYNRIKVIASKVSKRYKVEERIPEPRSEIPL